MKLSYKQLTTLVAVLEKEISETNQAYEAERMKKDEALEEMRERIFKGEKVWSDYDALSKELKNPCDTLWEHMSRLEGVLETITEEIEI